MGGMSEEKQLNVGVLGLMGGDGSLTSEGQKYAQLLVFLLFCDFIGPFSIKFNS
jgi:hypothetical protein